MISTSIKPGWILVVLLLVILLLIIRCWFVWKSIRTTTTTTTTCRRDKPIKTVVVLGSGGHTTEMLELLEHLNPNYYQPMVFVVAASDTTSLRRYHASSLFQKQQQSQNSTAVTVYQIPRSREVGQSYFSSIFTTLWSLIWSFQLMLRLQPGLLLCNGPGTCLPIAVMTLMFRILGFCEGRIVFCESFCRVTSLSLTGKLLYPIVDLFVVHWEPLKESYPRSHLVSTFVPHSGITTTKSS